MLRVGKIAAGANRSQQRNRSTYNMSAKVPTALICISRTLKKKSVDKSGSSDMRNEAMEEKNAKDERVSYRWKTDHSIELLRNDDKSHIVHVRFRRGRKGWITKIMAL